MINTFFFRFFIGLCVGLLDPFTLSQVGRFFVKKRTTAFGIVFVGNAIGTLFLAPMFTFIVHYHSLQGGLLIFAGCVLHNLLIPAVAWPIPLNQATDTVTISITSNTESHRTKDKDFPQVIDLDITSSHVNGKHSQQIGTGSACQGVISNSSGSTRENHKDIDLDITASQVDVEADSTSHVVVHDGSTIEDVIVVKDDGIQRVSHANIQKSATKKTKREVISSTCQIFHRLNKNVDLLVVSAMLFCGYFSYYSTFFVLPPLALELNMTKMDASLVLSMISTIEIISRVSTGIIVDRYRISKLKLLVGSYVMSGVAIVIVSFVTKVEVLYGYTIVHGTSAGTCLVIGLPILLEMVDESKRGRITSLFAVLAGSGSTLGPVLLGKSLLPPVISHILFSSQILFHIKAYNFTEQSYHIYIGLHV